VVLLRDGTDLPAFYWTRGSDAGIAVAMKTAEDAGVDAVAAWAEPLEY
jgi:pyruvate carboxylase